MEGKKQWFKWELLGDISTGRPNLGESSLVGVYRLMQYSLRDILIREFDDAKARELFVEAGRLAGSEFCKHVLKVNLNFDEFIADLQAKLKNFGIGILKIEEANLEKLKFIITVAEDLDCSGLPMLGETVCDYDEGFIAGILETYTGKKFNVKEVDCWASGGRVCRFHAHSDKGE
jgi:uncharacterized protein